MSLNRLLTPSKRWLIAKLLTYSIPFFSNQILTSLTIVSSQDPPLINNLPRPKVDLLIFISIWILTLKTFMWVLWQRNFSPFFTVPLHMSPQRTLDRAGKVTLVALVWLFSTVCFQMSPQIACLRKGKVTLVAFVRLFSTVRFQMFPQIACMRRCIVTLAAFDWLFSTVC